MTNVRNVPKLRFPEFREALPWSIKQLKQVCAVNPATSELPEVFAYIDLESVEAGELKAKKIISREAVSYTHLDVYKRQSSTCSRRCSASRPNLTNTPI